MKIPSISAILISLVLTMCTNLVAAAQLSNHNSSALSQNASTKLIIDDIICRGNDTTECAFVTNKYFQAVGDELDPEEIADARLRLGTLIQFQSVSVYLEKGNERNHVVVVFDVIEASNLFYEFGFSAHQRTRTIRRDNDFRTDSKDGSLNAKVTNFNFLGTGKELSLAVTADRLTPVSRYSILSINSDSQSNTVSEYLSETRIAGTNDSASLSLGYFDPHLFGTSHYYMSVNLQVNQFRRDQLIFDTTIEPMPVSTTSERRVYKTDWTRQSLVLGRRFARYSFVALDVTRSIYDTSDDTVHGLTVGWNSEDDVLLPTKGSSFSTRFSKFRDDWEIDLNFKQNIALAPNKIVSLGSNITHNLPNIYCNFCALVMPDSFGATLFGRYTVINPIDKKNGEFNSWYVGGLYGQSNIAEDIYNYRYWGISAGYTYQTESMIFRFSLAYTDQKDHN